MAIRIDYLDYALFEAEQTIEDRTVEYDFTETLPDVLRKAIEIVSNEGIPAFFVFNGREYRITLDALRAFTQQHDNLKQVSNQHYRILVY